MAASTCKCCGKEATKYVTCADDAFLVVCKQCNDFLKLPKAADARKASDVAAEKQEQAKRVRLEEMAEQRRDQTASLVCEGIAAATSSGHYRIVLKMSSDSMDQKVVSLNHDVYVTVPDLPHALQLIQKRGDYKVYDTTKSNSGFVVSW